MESLFRPLSPERLAVLLGEEDAALGKRGAWLRRVRLALVMSVPAIVAQISSIVMQYIDAAMVGSLGAAASASIGLVSTTIWLFGGLCSAVVTGFAVQVAHRVGAGNIAEARAVFFGAVGASALGALLLLAVGAAISGALPHWLGGEAEICAPAARYFLIFSLSLPIIMFFQLGVHMLRCSGDLLTPSWVSVTMCVLDVLLNALLIFPSREIVVGGYSIFIYGADLGVTGAALGTSLAELLALGLLLLHILRRSPYFAWHSSNAPQRSAERRMLPSRKSLSRALRIGLPIGMERVLMCGAQIATTVIVAPLGTVALAANSFGITIESLCYMPGYGISSAATTLVGQSLGGGRRRLARSFARITVGMGVAAMTFMGVLMYVFAPWLMQTMTPDAAVQALAVRILRIEAFAEPGFAASIVAYGVFVGAGDTRVPCTFNLLTIWGVRITLALLLVGGYGLVGVWCAMAVELCVRGLIFLIRLFRERWLQKADV